MWVNHNLKSWIYVTRTFYQIVHSRKRVFEYKQVWRMWMSNVTLPALNNKSAWQLLSAHDEICRLCHVGIHVQHGRSHKNKKSFVALTVFMSQTQHNSLTKLMHKIMTPCTPLNIVWNWRIWASWFGYLWYTFFSVALVLNARDSGKQNIGEVNLHVFLSNAQKWLMAKI